MSTNVPWYRQFDTWAAKANQYLEAFIQLPKDAPHHKELAAFAEFSEAQLIFESNLIEGAGLTEGETRKVMAQYCPQLPSSYEAFRESQRSLMGTIADSYKRLESLRETILHLGPRPDTIIPSILFTKKSRRELEVVHHVLALSHATMCTRDFKLQRATYKLVKDLPSIRTDPRAVNFLRSLEALYNVDLDTPSRDLDTPPPPLITEKSICAIHKNIASGLLPEDAGVAAGQYRIDNRIVGWDIMFPAPELIPAAMHHYVARAHEVLTEALAGHLDRYLAAAQISYEFVRIHPFPDFNGRVSRLLLMMVLNACGVPFPVTLRGDSKSKKRYFRALKLGNAGNLQPYGTLIAMRVVQAFEAVEHNLAIAGLPSILNFATTADGANAPG